MTDERPQYYENALAPLPINAAALTNALTELRGAVRKGAVLIHENSPLPDKWGVGGIFKHFPGIALAFLRLNYQRPVLTDDNGSSPDYLQFALQRIPPGLPDIPLIPSRLSPAGSFSPVTAVILRTLATLATNSESNGGARPSISKEDVACLHGAVDLALKNGPLVSHDGRDMGGDEMLYGRAGLLWTLLNIRAHRFDDETENALSPVMENIPELIRLIIDAGRQGSRNYIEQHGAQDAHPLMYAWMEGFYCFGAVHGLTGILAILLACKPEELTEYLSVLGETITALCKHCNAHNGHLPMTLPPRSYGTPSELVQICHGSPGILILLAAALKNEPLTRGFWDPEWDQTIYLATGRIWEEGLLSKGGSLCHGITGNAWPWLLLHDSFEYHSEQIESARREYLQRSQVSAVPNEGLRQKLTADFFLARVLAFFLHAQETRPYNTSPVSSDRDYRMPDDPYSMFEGLSGNVCAWADACAVIRARLRKMELSVQGEVTSATLNADSVFQEAMRRQIGFPALGGNGATGFF